MVAHHDRAGKPGEDCDQQEEQQRNAAQAEQITDKILGNARKKINNDGGQGSFPLYSTVTRPMNWPEGD